MSAASPGAPLYYNQDSMENDDALEGAGDVYRQRRADSLDVLLSELYWHWPQVLRSDSTTDQSTSENVHTDHLRHDNEARPQHSAQALAKLDIPELKKVLREVTVSTNQFSTRLVRLLKSRERRRYQQQKHCDVITAVLHASSDKTHEDTRLKFSVDPQPGESAFLQWRDAMRAVARLPAGIPPQFRSKIWLALADRHIRALRLDWDATVRLAFNDRANPDDSRLDEQIVKDLHRTGSSGFSGQENAEDRAVLKRVLLAFARWNKQIGYCQGFNVIAALLLEVTERRETDALKLMIFLIDHVLPDGYFTPELRALSVDMAVLRELLSQARPRIAGHLDKLAAQDREASGYEPPLVNVFSMQWLVTLFATCLPKDTVLRLWDSVLLEGSEILLRTSIAIWSRLQKHVLQVTSADEFYTCMSSLCAELLSGDIVSDEDLIKTIYSMGPFPLPQLAELREKYTYNITPFSAAMALGARRVYKDGKDASISCFTGMIPGLALSAACTSDKADYAAEAATPPSKRPEKARKGGGRSPRPSSDLERTTTDIGALSGQYRRLQQRQTQAKVMINAAFEEQSVKAYAAGGGATSGPLNHLLLSAKYGRLAAQGRAGKPESWHTQAARRSHIKALTQMTRKIQNFEKDVSSSPSKNQVNASSLSSASAAKAREMMTVPSTRTRTSTEVSEPRSDADTLSADSDQCLSDSDSVSSNNNTCRRKNFEAPCADANGFSDRRTFDGDGDSDSTCSGAEGPVGTPVATSLTVRSSSGSVIDRAKLSSSGGVSRSSRTRSREAEVAYPPLPIDSSSEDDWDSKASVSHPRANPGIPDPDRFSPVPLTPERSRSPVSVSPSSEISLVTTQMVPTRAHALDYLGPLEDKKEAKRFRTPEVVRPFNPFPVRQNRQAYQRGLKLGLYK